MADADYKVEAELELKTSAAESGARRTADELRRAQSSLEGIRGRGAAALRDVGGVLQGIGQRLSWASSWAFRLATGAVAVVGTYIGLRAVEQAVEGIARASLGSNVALENMTMGLGTVIAELEGVPFDQAERMAGGLYRRMQDVAMVSPGTAAELADVFQSAYGPMRQAGAGMEDILRLSQNTLSVASALRIDLPQVSRDIQAMASGVAGADVRTFRLLHSMGLIREDARAWNEMARRDPAQASRRLMEVFEQLGGPAAERFGATWAGVTSSFSDLMTNFARIAGSATFARLRDTLGQIVAWLSRYRQGIENVLTFLGGVAGTLFDRLRNWASSATDRVRLWLGAHIDTIDRAVGRLWDLLPAVKGLAGAFAMIAGAAAVFGPVVRVAGWLLSALGGLGGLLPLLGGGGAAAGTAAAGTAAGGGAMAAVTAALAAAAPVIAIVAAALSALAVVVGQMYVAAQHFGSRIWDILAPLQGQWEQIWADLSTFGTGVWDILEPIFALIGSLDWAALASGLRLATMGLSLVARALASLGVIMSWVGSVMRPPITALAESILAAVGAVWQFIGGVRLSLSMIPGMSSVLAPPVGGSGGGSGLGDLFARLRDAWRQGAPGAPQLPDGPPADRSAGTTIDMRGSRIEVRQDFREADPDRIWIQFQEGLSREAVHRVSSGLVPALTR